MACESEKWQGDIFRQMHLSEGEGVRKKELLRAVRLAVEGELTARQRQCIALVYGQNLSVQETAKQLSICPSTVSRHLKKARARIKRVLAYGYFPIWREEEEWEGGACIQATER